jgi:hypothetical protein
MLHVYVICVICHLSYLTPFWVPSRLWQSDKEHFTLVPIVLTAEETVDCQALTKIWKNEDQTSRHTILSYCTGEFNEDEVTTAERLHSNGVLTNLVADDKEQVSYDICLRVYGI